MRGGRAGRRAGLAGAAAAARPFGAQRLAGEVPAARHEDDGSRLRARTRRAAAARARSRVAEVVEPLHDLVVAQGQPDAQASSGRP